MATETDDAVSPEKSRVAHALLRQPDMEATYRAELALRICFAGVLAGTAVAAFAGCSSVSPSSCSGDDAGKAPTFDVTFKTCPLDGGPEADAGDSSPDASADEDAGPSCFATCDEACSALEPAAMTSQGIGQCESADAGGTGLVVAHCAAVAVCMGRTFDGLETPVFDDTLGGMLARMAWLEAASVHAFRRLARELAAHGAPRELIACAKACARDEIRHARMMTKLAKSRGVNVPPVAAVRDPAVRDLESIARENAVEGCVGETFGALQAAWRGSHGRDAQMAAAMRAIAPDELRHAALGWTVATWIEAKLDESARARVAVARAGAAKELIAKLKSPDERALASGLNRALWAA